MMFHISTPLPTLCYNLVRWVGGESALQPRFPYAIVWPILSQNLWLLIVVFEARATLEYSIE